MTTSFPESQALGEKYLMALYVASEGTLIPVLPDQICAKLGIEPEATGSAVARTLRSKNLVTWGDFRTEMSLTSEGLKVAEELMGKTWADEELIVLNKAVEIEKVGNQGFVPLNDLARELPQLTHSFMDLVNHLEEKRWFVPFCDEGVKVGPKGFEIYEGRSNEQRHAPVVKIDTFNAHNSAVAIGSNNTVYAQFNTNKDLGNTLAEIVKIIEASQISTAEKYILTSDINHISDLSAQENPKEFKVRALETIAKVIKTAATLGTIATQLGPHLESVKAWWELIS